MGNQAQKVLDSEVEDFTTDIPRISLDSTSNSQTKDLSIGKQSIEINTNFVSFKENFEFLDDIQKILELSGLDNLNLIFGIDYTFSNEVRGRKTFGGKSLHSIEDGIWNHYQSVILMVGKTLEKIDENSIIPFFGFGDKTSGADSVFLLTPNDKQKLYCDGYKDVLDSYCRITPTIKFNAQTNFAPLIKKSVEILKNNKEKILHILVIITDSDVTNSKKQENMDAIIEASKYPLSIIVIGVGDGPFGDVPKYSDLKERTFDNVSFISLKNISSLSFHTMTSFQQISKINLRIFLPQLFTRFHNNTKM
eukprot:gene9744-2071_t